MADKDVGSVQAPAAASSGTTGGASAKAIKGNPVFRMMGFPNFRMKLPSRNWSIFRTIVGSWTAAVVYDRREKKKIQRKWSNLVSHLASDTMPTNTLPRKLTVYVEAPPGDGLTSARDHFHEYVKPILVAAAMDWDAVEGRREGDIRAGLAEKIRKIRRLKGETSAAPVEQDAEMAVLASRAKSGIKPTDAVAGDIIIGRHTWKEYVRGLHEGWLGPLDPPATKHTTATSFVDASSSDQSTPPLSPDSQLSSSDAASPTAPLESANADQDVSEQEEEKIKEDAEKSKKRTQPPPYNMPSDYSTSYLAPTIPYELSPSAPIPFPHLLGFLNTPIRMYRFLNRRKLADEVGRETAAVVMAVYRPYYSATDAPVWTQQSDGGSSGNESATSEIEKLLEHEEKEWHKSVRDRSKEEGRERIWLDDVVLDSRITERMRRFELDLEQESRAKQIAANAQPWWREMWSSFTEASDAKKEV